MTLGERLKELRNGVPQADFAKKVGVTANTVGRLERGENTPDAGYLNSVLALYPDISPAWLLTGEGPKKRSESGNSRVAEDHALRWSSPPRPKTVAAVEKALSQQPAPSREDAPLELMKQWIDEFWRNADDDYRAWFKIEFKKRWPEFAEWLEKK